MEAADLAQLSACRIGEKQSAILPSERVELVELHGQKLDRLTMGLRQRSVTGVSAQLEDGCRMATP